MGSPPAHQREQDLGVADQVGVGEGAPAATVRSARSPTAIVDRPAAGRHQRHVQRQGLLGVPGWTVVVGVAAASAMACHGSGRLTVRRIRARGAPPRRGASGRRRLGRPAGPPSAGPRRPGRPSRAAAAPRRSIPSRAKRAKSSALTSLGRAHPARAPHGLERIQHGRVGTITDRVDRREQSAGPRLAHESLELGGVHERQTVRLGTASAGVRRDAPRRARVGIRRRRP